MTDLFADLADGRAGKMNFVSPKLKLDELFISWLCLPETQQNLAHLLKGLHSCIDFSFPSGCLEKSGAKTCSRYRDRSTGEQKSVCSVPRAAVSDFSNAFPAQVSIAVA
jgi:hypothetical protein